MGNIIECNSLTVRYKSTTAIHNLALSIPAGLTVGVIGPDGVGKSALLSLIAGERVMQKGQLQVLGGDMRDEKHRAAICSDIAYMPQGLGKNLYPTLSVEEAVCRRKLTVFCQTFWAQSCSASCTNRYPYQTNRTLSIFIAPSRVV